MRLPRFVLVLAVFLAGLLASAPASAQTQDLRVLFLGDDGHHEPELRAKQVLPVLAAEGIHLTYTDDQSDLRPEVLGRYDALLFYGNRTGLPEDQERALLDYVAEGGGLVALHSASGSFNDSPAFVNLVGGTFHRHGTGVFTTDRVRPDHPAIPGLPELESWDETYVHDDHNPDRTVLAVRRYGPDDRRAEPWTWVRTHGEGRVFYTAWGHDERTWSKEAFHRLLERGVRWAAGGETIGQPSPEEPFEYVSAKVPYYPPGEDWGTTGEPFTRMQRPLDPERSLEQMVVPPGFELDLVASEPTIRTPLDLAWDAEGRLWIAESADYPNDIDTTRGVGSDRIVIARDENGDGRIDGTTVFAENLSLPTSMTFARGGLIVTEPPRTLFLRDTTGDGRADVRRVLFDGWGTFDTHAGPSNLRRGPDNWIWGTVGYSGFEGTVGGSRHRFAQAIYRFRPDGSELEVIRSTTNNTWGLGFNEQGDVFASTANGNPSVHAAIPNRYAERLRLWDRDPLPTIAEHDRYHPIVDTVRQVDHHGRYTSGAGHALYTARRFPREYWNRSAFVAGPTGHLLGRFEIEEQGAGYRAENEWNMLASRDRWTAPIAAEVGPDGALWMIDWYNYIVQHNPVPDGWTEGRGNAYASDLRDHERGRIVRILPEEGAAAPSPNLAGGGPQAWVDGLDHPNMRWRLTAQRLIVDRGASGEWSDAELRDALLAHLESETTDALGLDPGAFHAVWAMEGLGLLEGGDEGGDPEAIGAAVDAVHHPSAGVRRAALRALPRTAAVRDSLMGTGLLPPPPPRAEGEEVSYARDPSWSDAADPKVRLDLFLALSEMPASEEVGRSVFTMLQAPDTRSDSLLVSAAAVAGARHRSGFMGAVLGSESRWIEEDELEGGVARAVRLVAGQVAAEGSDAEVRAALEGLGNAPASITGAVLDGLLGGWPEDRRLSETEETDQAIASIRSGYGPEMVSRLEGVLAQAGWFQAGAGAEESAGGASEEVLSGEASVTIRPVGNQMRYATTSIRARAGTELTIVFENTATSAAMSHNVVVVEGEDAIEPVGQAALEAADSEYIPASEENRIVAYTALAAPGETVRVTFTVPEDPGDYPYVCTFPGHYRSMQGTLTVIE